MGDVFSELVMERGSMLNGGKSMRRSDSQQYAKMTIAPENMPPTPSPATARPTIKALLLGAVAQTRELHESQQYARGIEHGRHTQAQRLQWQ